MLNLGIDCDKNLWQWNDYGVVSVGSKIAHDKWS